MDLPDMGTVLDATRIDDVVLVLRREGPQRVKLADGSSALLLRFDLPARFGGLRDFQDFNHPKSVVN